MSAPNRAPERRVRVVITGMGTVNPLGNTVEEFWQGLISGRSGASRISLFDPTGYPCTIAAEVKNFDPSLYVDRKEARRLARFSQFAAAAAKMTMADARLDLGQIDPERAGVLLGVGQGSLLDIEEQTLIMKSRGGNRVSPFFIPMELPNMAAAQLSMMFGLVGYSNTTVTACAAGSNAIGEATEVIRRGWADLMLAGGSDADICEIGLAGFCAMRAFTTSYNDAPETASRPFDATRDGFLPGEGAGLLVLENLEHALARGAPILAEVAGYGASADAHHVVAPDPEGLGAARAMRWALQDAGVSPASVDYINAHGTSTPLNDAIETVAIKKVFGEAAYRIPISSTKAMIGHLLGAAGAVEAIACIKTITTGMIHPTINYRTPDPICDLDYVPNEARAQAVRVVLSNSFGFGGQNACLVFTRFDG